MSWDGEDKVSLYFSLTWTLFEKQYLCPHLSSDWSNLITPLSSFHSAHFVSYQRAFTWAQLSDCSRYLWLSSLFHPAMQCGHCDRILSVAVSPTPWFSQDRRSEICSNESSLIYYKFEGNFWYLDYFFTLNIYFKSIDFRKCSMTILPGNSAKRLMVWVNFSGLYDYYYNLFKLHIFDHF